VAELKAENARLLAGLPKPGFLDDAMAVMTGAATSVGLLGPSVAAAGEQPPRLSPREEGTALHAELVALRQGKSQMQYELEAALKEKAEAEKQVAEAATKAAELEEEVEVLLQANHELEFQTTEACEQARSAQGVVEGLESTVASLKGQLGAMSAAAEEMEAELRDQVSELQTARDAAAADVAGHTAQWWQAQAENLRLELDAATLAHASLTAELQVSSPDPSLPGENRPRREISGRTYVAPMSS
jgi:hypothetical protein